MTVWIKKQDESPDDAYVLNEGWSPGGLGDHDRSVETAGAAAGVTTDELTILNERFEETAAAIKAGKIRLSQEVEVHSARKKEREVYISARTSRWQEELRRGRPPSLRPDERPSRAAVMYSRNSESSRVKKWNPARGQALDDPGVVIVHADEPPASPEPTKTRRINGSTGEPVE